MGGGPKAPPMPPTLDLSLAKLAKDELHFAGKRHQKPEGGSPPEPSSSGDDLSYSASSEGESSTSEDSATSRVGRTPYPYNLRKRQKMTAIDDPQKYTSATESHLAPVPPEEDPLSPREREQVDRAVMGFIVTLLGQPVAPQPPVPVDPVSSDEEGKGGIQVISHKKSPFGPKAEKLGFQRIAGMEPLKADLHRLLIDPMKNPQVYKDYGLENSASGVLLYGPPGNGKTFFAKAVAEEAGANFLEIHPSTIASPYIHQTSKFISEAFDAAAAAAKKSRKPTVLLIDEVDAVAPQRMGDSSNNHNNEEVAEFLNQLNECATKNVFVVATTNLPDNLDPALIRSGRMNAKIYVGAPDEKSRAQVINQYLKLRSPRVVDEAIDVSALASKTQGYSIADLKELVNQSARHALQRRAKISDGDFKLAMKQVLPSISDSTEEAYKQMMGKFESKPSSEAWKTMYT